MKFCLVHRANFKQCSLTLTIVLIFGCIVYPFMTFACYSPTSADVKKAVTKDVRNSHIYRKIVIIIAYMRTGSTLTASLFQEYPGTFYVFEPIREVTQAFMENQTYTTINYLHGMNKNYTSEDRQKVIDNDVNAWLTCDLRSVSLLSLTAESHRKQNTRITNELYSCMYDSLQNGTSDPLPNDRLQKPKDLLYERLQQPNIDRSKLDNCLDKAIKACEESQMTVLKFIRLRMRNVKGLIRKYPNMKVIHLVRDPRGIINSRINVRKVDTYDNDPESLCTYLLDDLIVLKSSLQRYSDRIKTVRYEDMAKTPIETSKELVQFTGLDFTEHAYNFVREQTFSEKDADPYQIQRKNSAETAQKWRCEISLQDARFVYDKCKLSNKILGYLPLETLSELRDLRKPSMYRSDIEKELELYNK